MRKIILAAIVLIVLSFGVYMFNKRDYVSTQAVFVATNSLVNLSFKLDGKINNMTKNEGDSITKGELLASLQTDILHNKITQLSYDIKSLTDKKESLQIQKAKLQKAIALNIQIATNKILSLMQDKNALEYQIKANLATLDKLAFDKDKFQKLYNLHKISLAKYKAITSKYTYLLNTVLAQKAQLKKLAIATDIAKMSKNIAINSQKEVASLTKEIMALDKKIKSLNTTQNILNIKLRDSYLYAPFDGVIAKKFVNTNTVLKKGMYVYSIVNPKDVYIKVLLSQKKLKDIRIGNKALVKLDGFDDEYEGRVIKILPVSAATFSLVPRDIASGEFTKLDQRFIVKIAIKYNPKMRIGMGGEAKIYKR
ncbi:MAG: HlyD family efflux transporter periplasmic adaptor subunit [Epsilonproteobacteria bacterium]|nr:HlyD family efflux transporter periplasmic adaptor subunit [Campylobacterota bacterium]